MENIVYRALKIRIYPNKTQETLINKTLGCARFIYNQMLAERIEIYEKLKDDRRKLYEYKYKTEKEYKEEFEFLKEVSSVSLQQSRMDLSSSYQNFFKSLKKQRKGEKVGFPKFHKKGRKDSYREVMLPKNMIDFENKKVKIPKLGWLNFRDKRLSLNGKIKSATVSRTKTGKYFVSILYEKELVLKPKEINLNLKAKGLDMSLSNFFVDEQGDSPLYEQNFRKLEKRIAFLQKQVSRKKLGSNNRKKAQLRVNKIYEKIANRRKDFTHKLSTELSSNYDIIVVENLNLKAMSQCLHLGKSINDLGYGMFLQQLQYKMLETGNILIEADKWFASSKTCSKCGYVHKDLQLGDRVFNCPSCNFEINRDHNAGINLLNYGLNFLGMERTEFKLVESINVDNVNELTMKQEAFESLAQR